MSKSIEINLVKLKAAYSTVFQLTHAIGFVLEHDKSEVFHFSRNSVNAFVPVDLGYSPYMGDTPLVPKRLWRYLGFFFDCKLLFIEHAKMYATKSFSAMMAMAFLGNSNYGLSPKHKCLVY